MARELTQDERDDLTPGELAAMMGEPTEEAAAAALAEKTGESVAAERAAEAAADLDDDATAAAQPTPEALAAEEAARAAAAATTDETKEEGAEAKPELTAEQLAAVLEDDAPAAAAPKPVTYKGISDADYKAETTKLNAEKAEALAKLMAGDIEPAAYAAIEAEIADKRDDLVSNRTLARANLEAAEQEAATKIAEFQTHIGELMKTTKGGPIDYSVDQRAQVQFDQASRLIAEDPANASLTPKQVCDQAHRMVQALRGIAAAPAPAVASPATATKTPAVVKSPPPVTLGGLPAAAPNAVGSDLRSQFMQLEGDDAEEFLERLPKAQRQALMAGGMV